MKHTITKTEQGYVCQVVNPYSQNDFQSVNKNNSGWEEFDRANPEYHFIHPDPLPENAIVDGEDLGEPFPQYRRELNRMPLEDDWFNERPLGHEYPLTSRMAVALKHPEMMICVDGVFIRKEQIKSPRLEERRKDVSQEAKDIVDCYTSYQELFNYMSNEHDVTLQMGDIHKIIEIMNRIE